MKDKILALIKDNKTNVGLFVAVLVASAILFKLSFVYKAETEKLKEQKERLSNDAKQINSTRWLLEQVNSNVANSNADSYKETFNTYYQGLVDKYNHNKDDVATFRPEDVQDKFIESIDLLKKICKNARVDISEGFEFSFDGVRSQIFKMDPRDKVKVMEQLSAVESLVKIAASSSVKGITSIDRINNLELTQVKEKFAKVYSFRITLNTDPESFAAFMNKVSNDSSFYFRVNNVSLKTSPQVDAELKPLALNEVKKVQGNTANTVPNVANVEDLIAGVEVGGVEKEEVEEEPVKEEPVNIQAFKSVDQTVVIGLDWIQFKDSYLEK